MFSIDQLSRILPDFIKNSMRDRHQYDIVYDHINQYISNFVSINEKSLHGDQKIIIGGCLGISSLLKIPLTIDDFTYILYTESAFIHANNLTNKIAENIKDKWLICMKTIIQNNTFEIIVDNRKLVTIIRLTNVPEGTTMANIINPILSQLNNKSCLVMNPMFYLIDLYRTLYSPDKISDWQSSLNQEKLLFEYLKRVFTESKKNNGGKRRHYFGKYEQKKYPADITNNEVCMFIIRNYIVNNSSVVLIGDAAQRLLIKSSIISPVLTIISNNKTETDIENISQLLVRKYGNKYPVSYIHGNVKVINDFRLTRTSIKVGSEHDKKDILYIYNSAEYELIPFNKIGNTDFIQVGNPFVLLRFHLIDIWIVRWLVASGKLDSIFAEHKIFKIMKNVIELRSHLSTDTRQIMGTTDAHTIKYEIDISYLNDLSCGIFQKHSDQYIGTIYNEITAYKLYIQQRINSAKSRGIYSSMYHPQKYYLEYGKYRNIENSEKNND